MTRKTRVGNTGTRRSRQKTQQRVELVRPKVPSPGVERPQRKPSGIITPEEFSYVKRDLMTIGILSSIMVSALVILTFILGID
jgi:hypothetical protein